MPEPAEGTQGQQPEGQGPQDPEPAPQQPQGGAEGTPAEPGDEFAKYMNREAVEALLKSKRDANAEAKKLRLQLEKLQKQQEEEKKKAERERLDELERLKLDKEDATKEAAQYKSRLERAMKTNQTIAVAARMRFIDPNDAVRMINLDKLEIAEDGEVLGVEEELESLAQAKPYLIVQEAPTEPQRAKLPATGPTSPAPEQPKGSPGVERAKQQIGEEQTGEQIAEAVRRGDAVAALRLKMDQFRKKIAGTPYEERKLE